MEDEHRDNDTNQDHTDGPEKEENAAGLCNLSVAILITTALFYALRNEENEKGHIIRITDSETISDLAGNHTIFENHRYYISASIEIESGGKMTIKDAVVVPQGTTK